MSELSPERLAPEKILLEERLRGGQAWSRRLRRGQVLRIVDLDARACVSALFYNARDPLERYNMPDTLKAQYTAFLTRGRVLYSDMGRVLCSVIGDTAGWHDTITGMGDAQALHANAGAGSYQELRNDFHRNARDNFLVELGKHGLGKRDIVANVNFFVRAAVASDGALTWRELRRAPGAYVDLRFEMDTLAVLSNTPHPLDPGGKYAPPDVALVIWQGAAPLPDDPCRMSRPENARGFALTEAYAAEYAEAEVRGH
ncbi:MAG TPA: urea amidolyase associated protein UAAP1 [Polyangiaceae bacterium]|nr:urea amidolyase associated protein UAAP1 [Polyangiaceae bacterium]